MFFSKTKVKYERFIAHHPKLPLLFLKSPLTLYVIGVLAHGVSFLQLLLYDLFAQLKQRRKLGHANKDCLKTISRLSAVLIHTKRSGKEYGI